jgi:5-formyltetrahydrofolate cyclo-ligase
MLYRTETYARQKAKFFLMVLESKNELRSIFLQKRAVLSDKDRKLKSREIVRKFYSNISLQPKSVIAGYFSYNNEVDIALLMELYAETGHQICYPAIEEKNAPMIFREFNKGVAPVKNNFLNFYEPPETCKEVIPNVIITPLVAFDSAGNRLGQGSGYYDRTMDYLSGVTDFIAVGVSFACQQAQFIKPGIFDYRLDATVTEEKVFIF